MRVFIVTVMDGASAQFVDAEVRDFEHESVVDDAVRTFQTSVRFYVGIVQVRHALDTALAALYYS